jgi:beta-phosphoglucomutase-like phosphatase (HAD superfamily)
LPALTGYNQAVKKLKAAIFDMDGLLLDTKRIALLTFSKLAGNVTSSLTLRSTTNVLA